MCTDTYVEVQLNGEIACLRREISDESQRPLFIFWGAYERAVNSGNQFWERYPFKRTIHQTSFSQALFDALGMPQAQGEGASHLTLHQILRVLYADQPSVHSPIFREDTFDRALTRETIGGYLCGVYEDELYSAQLRAREINVHLSKYISELRGIFHVLGRSGQTPDLVSSREKIVELEALRIQLTQYLIQLKSTRSLPRRDANKALIKADELRAKLNEARHIESAKKDALAAVELDLGDSYLFVRELEERLRNLDESKETRSYFGAINFNFCPSCLSELKKSRTNSSSCHLCTTELSEDHGSSQLLRMRNELTIQLKESKSLIEARIKTRDELRRDIQILTAKVKLLEGEYASVSTSWSSEVEVMLEETSRKLGVLDEEIRQAHEHQKLAVVISELQNKRDELTAELAQLDERIGSLELLQEGRKSEVAQEVESAMIRLLKQDLPLQPEFINPSTVTFSFVDNTVTVNGSRNFSESSAVVLRHIFHLALMTTAVKRPYMRVPRFLMLDGIDDGGMEKERSHRLQEIIVEECTRYQVDYQVIFATSEINPDYEDSDFVVGRAFSPEARSLDIR